MTVAPERPADTHTLIGCPSRRHQRTPRDQERPPRLAEGVQLLGEYAGTGYETPQHLARRPGGQLVQLSQLLHQVADACDGTSDVDEIAQRVTASYGKTVTPDNVRVLIDKLRPLGVLAAADGSSPHVQEADPLLGLSLRRQLLSPTAVRRLAALVRPVFWPPLVLAVVAGLVAVDWWLLFVHGVGAGLRSTVEQPLVFLLVAAVIVVSAALHEFGHAAACAYGGARPGGMGAGIYVVWPAFYTDVTEAYQLDRRGRLRTDLGGIYVNAMVVLATAAAYAATRYEPLVLICFLLQVQVLQQLLPFLRLDGYYVVSDLVGVPDLFRRIGPVLRSAIPFRPVEPEVAELKPWVRRVVAGWVFVLVPLLLLNLGYFVLAAPRIAATSWDSAARFVGQVPSGGLTAATAVVQLVVLLLPTVGITYTLVRTGRRAAAGAWRWSAGSAVRRTGVALGAAAVAGLLALAWWPDGRLTPYREGERGTIQQHGSELLTVGSGRPLLRTPSEAQEPLPPLEDARAAVPVAAEPPPTRPDVPAGADTTVVPTAAPTATPAVEPTGAAPTPVPTSAPVDGLTSAAPDTEPVVEEAPAPTSSPTPDQASPIPSATVSVSAAPSPTG